MSSDLYNLKVIMVATTVGALTFMGLQWYNKRRKNAPPTSWTPIGKVKKIFMYPLKSGRRLELKTAQCTTYGLQKLPDGNYYRLRDRCLIVYKDADKEFRTARTYPKMVLIEVTVEKSDCFVVKAPGMRELKLKMPDSKNGPGTFIKVFEKEEVYTIDCGDEAAEWFSTYITGEKSGLRLGFHNGTYKRDTKKVLSEFFNVHKNFSNKFLGMYSDLASFMVMNQASVDELVARIPDTTVTTNNFRPNIVVEGEKIGPYTEDSWDFVKFGDEVVLRAFKPCTRCTFTTIDPETGVRSQNMEPLKTLKSYRLLKDLTGIELEGDSPVMGVNMGLIIGGTVNVGDVVYLGRS